MAVPVIAASASYADSSNETTRNLTLPSGIASGHWLLLALNIDSTAAVTTPTGWTLVKSRATTAVLGTQYLYKRLADGTEGSTVTVVSDSEYITSVSFRITGADSTDCIDVVSEFYGERGNGDVRFGQCWAAYTDNLLLAIASIDGSTSSFSAAPSGFSSVVALNGGASGNAMASWQKDQAAQGYTGFIRATTANVGEAIISFLVVIRSTSGAITYPDQPVIRVMDCVTPDALTAVNYDNPYGTENDDVLVIINSTDTNTISLDGDFTSIQSTNASAAIYHNACRRIVNGSETPPYTALTSTSGAKQSVIMRIANADPTTPINGSTAATGTSANPAGSTLTPSVNNCLIISTYAADDDDEQLDTNYPSGYTGFFNMSNTAGADSSFGIAILAQTTATATGTVTWTSGLAASEEWVSLVIAIAPAPDSATEVNAGLADKSKVAYAPSISAGKSVAVGLVDKAKVAYIPIVGAGKSVIVPLADKSKVAYAPLVGVGATINVGIADKSKVSYEPTISAGKSIVVGLVDKGKAVYVPVVSAGKSVTAGLVDKSKVAYAPNLIMNIMVGLADKSKVAYEPVIATGVSIAVPLCDKTKEAFAPEILADAVVVVPLTDKTKVAYSPNVGAGKSVFLGLVDKGKVVYDIAVATGGGVTLSLVDKTKVVYGIDVVSGKNIEVPLVNKEKVVYGISVGVSGYVDVPLADKGVQVFNMDVFANDIVVPLVDKSKVAYAPQIAIEGEGAGSSGIHARPMVYYPGVLLGHG